MTLFVLASKDGWVTIMYSGLDAVGVDQQVGIQHSFTHITHTVNTIPYSTVQYNTIQYNTIQYNTIQYNTLQDL